MGVWRDVVGVRGGVAGVWLDVAGIRRKVAGVRGGTAFIRRRIAGVRGGVAYQGFDRLDKADDYQYGAQSRVMRVSASK